MKNLALILAISAMLSACDQAEEAAEKAATTVQESATSVTDKVADKVVRATDSVVSNVSEGSKAVLAKASKEIGETVGEVAQEVKESAAELVQAEPVQVAQLDQATDQSQTAAGNSLLGALKKAAGDIKEKSSEAWEVGKDAAGEAVDKTKGAVSEATDSVVEGAKEVGGVVADKAKQAGTVVVEKTGDLIEGAKDRGEVVVDKAKEVGAAAADKTEAVVENAKKSAATVGEKAGDWVEDTKEKGADILKQSKEAVMPDGQPAQENEPEPGLESESGAAVPATIDTEMATATSTGVQSAPTENKNIKQTVAQIVEALLKDDGAPDTAAHRVSSEPAVTPAPEAVISGPTGENQADLISSGSDDGSRVDSRVSKIALSELVGQLENALAGMEAAAGEARKAAKALNEGVWELDSAGE